MGRIGGGIQPEWVGQPGLKLFIRMALTIADSIPYLLLTSIVIVCLVFSANPAFVPHNLRPMSTFPYIQILNHKYN